MYPPDSRIYVGRLEEGRQVVYAVHAVGAEPLRTRDGECGWGAGAGDAVEDLARALLADAAGGDPADEASRRFAHQILARLPEDGFTLQRDTVNAWLRRAVTV